MSIFFKAIKSNSLVISFARRVIADADKADADKDDADKADAD